MKTLLQVERRKYGLAFQERWETIKPVQWVGIPLSDSVEFDVTDAESYCAIFLIGTQTTGAPQGEHIRLQIP